MFTPYTVEIDVPRSQDLIKDGHFSKKFDIPTTSTHPEKTALEKILTYLSNTTGKDLIFTPDRNQPSYDKGVTGQFYSRSKDGSRTIEDRVNVFIYQA